MSASGAGRGLGVAQEQRPQRAPADLAGRPHVALLRVPLRQLAGRHPPQRLARRRHVLGMGDVSDSVQSSSASLGRPRNSAIASLASAKRPSRRQQRHPDRGPLEDRAEVLDRLDRGRPRRGDVGEVLADADQVAAVEPAPARPSSRGSGRRGSPRRGAGRARTSRSRRRARSRGHECSVSGPRSSSTIRSVSTSLVGTKCSGSSPKIRYISRDHVISSRATSQSQEPSWAAAAPRPAGARPGAGP